MTSCPWILAFSPCESWLPGVQQHSFAMPFCSDVLFHFRSRTMEPANLPTLAETMKPWAQTAFSSFKLFSSGLWLQQWRADLHTQFVRGGANPEAHGRSEKAAWQQGAEWWLRVSRNVGVGFTSGSRGSLLWKTILGRSSSGEKVDYGLKTYFKLNLWCRLVKYTKLFSRPGDSWCQGGTSIQQ